MSLQLLLTLTLLAIASSHAFPQRISPETQKLLSQLVPSRYYPYAIPTSGGKQFSTGDSSESDSFDENDNDDSNNSEDNDETSLPVSAPGSSALFPTDDVDNLEAAVRLRANLWALANGDMTGALYPKSLKSPSPSDLAGGRGKRYIPGLGGLLMAQYWNRRHTKLGNAGKWKRQPHLGFHGSRG